MGEVLRDNNQIEASIVEYKKAITLQPDFRFAWIGLCWVESQRYAKLNSRPEKEWMNPMMVLNNSWQNANQLLSVRNYLQKYGYLACAEISENRFFRLKPPSDKEIIQSATVWIQLGNPQKALQLLNNLKPSQLNEQVSLHLVRSQAYLNQSDKNNASIELLVAEQLNNELLNEDVTAFINNLKTILETAD